MIINVQNLVKRYGDLVAVDHFNLQVRKGEIFGLLGPNGSGKSTTINCILSLLNYDKGTIEVFGKPISPTAYALKQDIGVVMQNVAVFDELTVYENIQYFCGLYIKNKEKRQTLVEEALRFVDLDNFRGFYPQKLSGGLLRRLNIACGIAHKPKLIILDEPTVAVDPQSRNAILEGIKRLNEEGATIVYTSHYMEEVEQLCTRIAIMDKGKMLATGTKESLKAMIRSSETIHVEIFNLEEKRLREIEAFDTVNRVQYKNNRLIVYYYDGKNNLMQLLNYLQSHNLVYSHVYSEEPTLNDVFLEITGKQLRD